MEKAVKMEGVNHEVWSVLADAYSRVPGSSEKARSAYERALEMVSSDLEVDPSNSERQAMQAYYLVRLGRNSQALETLNRVMESASKSSNVLFWSALVYEWAGDRERALETLTAAADAGYSPAVIQAASDLDDLRRDPRYRVFIQNP
jgi:Flp pilus assembly protein TadD